MSLPKMMPHQQPRVNITPTSLLFLLLLLMQVIEGNLAVPLDGNKESTESNRNQQSISASLSSTSSSSPTASSSSSLSSPFSSGSFASGDFTPSPSPSPSSSPSSSSLSSSSPSSALLKGLGCASPEVLVNGSPSPDILETVSGGVSPSGSVGNIQEIQFVGSVKMRTGVQKKRVCKIKCLNGVWVGPLCSLEPECVSLHSEDPHLVITADGNKVHDQGHFACSHGFQLDGATDTTCTPDGLWSHLIPRCKAPECDDLESLDGNLGIDLESRAPGSIATFSCKTGFTLTGSPSSVCLPNSSWSQPIPSCTPVTCSVPQIAHHGQVITRTSWPVGDTVQFACDDGYVLTGDALSTCLPNGTWSYANPSCKSMCGFPGEPGNGYILPTKFYYEIGEGISVVCAPNHQLLGPAFIYCNEQGRWSSPLPLCEEVSYLQDISTL